jgi:Flp pilus assembly protein CpaB
MRAMTLRVDATSSVEGWAAAGAVVDVLLVQDDKTNVVAEKVKIISAERSVTPMSGGDESPSIPSTVTLLVTQEQCLALNTAIPLGRIAFALRSNRDEENWATRSFSADRLRRGGITTDTEMRITGYASVHDNGDADRKEFALSGDKWIRTDVVPEGFFSARERR